MNEKEAQEIIDSVRKTYDKVVDPFIASRARTWDEFTTILSQIHEDDSILDAGCAHGRLIPTLLKHGIKKENYTGIDISENLIEKAKEIFPDIHFDIGDVCALPYTSNSFTTVISSAVLHHIPSKKLRIKVLEELFRVTKPHGKVILLVWNAFFFKHLWKSIGVSYVKSFFSLGKHEAGDMYLPFFRKEDKRYVHAFTKKELIQLMKQIPSKKLTVENKGRNFLIIIEK